MSSQKATYVTLILLAVLGVIYLNAANNLSVPTNPGTISQSYLPKILSYALFILIIISFVTTFFKKEDKKIKLPNMKIMLLTIIVTISYITLWSTFGYFYIFSFLFLITLLSVYRWSEGLNVKIVGINFSITIVITLFIYIIFDVAMNIKF